MQVTNPQGWMIVVVIWGILGALVIWSFTAELTETVQGTGILAIAEEQPTANFIIAIADAQSLEVGMEARLEVGAFPSQEFGFLTGTVDSIKAQSDGSFVAVTVALETAATPTNLSWTIGDGPDATLFDGMPVSGTFIISKERPIGRVFPGLGSSSLWR